MNVHENSEDCFRESQQTYAGARAVQQRGIPGSHSWQRRIGPRRTRWTRGNSAGDWEVVDGEEQACGQGGPASSAGRRLGADLDGWGSAGPRRRRDIEAVRVAQVGSRRRRSWGSEGVERQGRGRGDFHAVGLEVESLRP